MKIGEYLRRVQNLPLIKRKIIFWLVIIILGLILLTFYIINIRKKIKTFSVEKSLKELKLSELKTEIEELPKFELGKEVSKLKADVGEIKRLIEKSEEQKNNIKSLE